jgi:hypothetical protein
MTARRFVDPAFVYHRHGRATPSAPTDLGPSKNVGRFADLAVVYHRHKQAMPTAPDVPVARSKLPVYHSVAIHHDPGTSTQW